MIEQYRGYEIKVYWSNIDLGYVFCVFSMDGEGIMESGTYFYEENAWIGARETVDRYIEVKERGLTGGLSDIYNHPYNDNHFIMWNSLFR